MITAKDADPTINPDDFVPTGTFSPKDYHADQLLSLLAWCVSAAAVAGVITVGMQLAFQLRRGEPGEGATYFRGLIFVIGACVLGATAGPLVTFLL
ncbi:hypothetical protein [Streptomyces sp. NPDC047061]|uniref:hypothetical protein n=1 Tax=Streptomyces sp. NPDC047061 TaxID=3154605 RepID=UPI0033E3E74B